MSLQLSVIIPVWNCWELTRNCLNSLREFTPGNFMQVIVVDNGSSDETASQLPTLGQQLFGSNFVYTRNEQNLGFAKACNQGAALAKANLLFFLNNDTLLLKNWLAPMLAAFRQDPKLGACGPLLLYPNGKNVQHLGIAFSTTLATEHLYANFPKDHPVVTRRRPLQAITGAALMLPKKLFEDSGRFFEGYVNGSEDLELCARISAQGKTLTVVPQSQIIHLESQTPGRNEHNNANAELLNQRCQGAFAPDLHRHARRDGFGLALTPWLELFITLPPEQEIELCHIFAPGFEPELYAAGKAQPNLSISPGLWWHGVQQEPLWQPGYEMLGNFLEQNGNFQEAAGLRLLQSYFFPLIPTFRALARVASKSDHPELACQAMEKIEHITKQLEDVDSLLHKSQKLASWAKKAGEPELAALYENWL